MAELPDSSNPTRQAIFAGYEADARQGFRTHLGASLIGKECERALWYDFRWTTKAKFPGRVLRLFETGNREEERLVRNLRRTGATVVEVDPQTGRQLRVAAHGGHFGGSLDAVALDLIEAPKTWHVVEFKTHAQKSFTDLAAKKVRESKPQHYAQMQVYMLLTEISRAMYLGVNKNTDDLYVERIELDKAFASQLLEKAGRIIFAPNPLPRISEDPAWYQCRLCDHASVCQGSRSAEINCRTCLHATPVEGGWHCARHDKPLSDVDQRMACDKHLYLPSLISGVQVDAGQDWVEYVFADGDHWRDSGVNKTAKLEQFEQVDQVDQGAS